MSPYEIAAYSSTCFGVLTAIVLIVVGAVMARPAHATAGMVIAGAGVVQLLSSCCVGVLGSPQLAMRFGSQGLMSGMSCTNAIADAVTWGLVAYGAVLLAQAGAAVPPTQASAEIPGGPS